ncbi:transmembrane protein 205 [Phtheirospermum japonicum]|uniref:Transmembrane protein 205 n=1 Tax=Phtheirospermum japonicum TaxID=374723 RepID=A0A830B2N2_9LAMI|nr:transmembrane protein 205 [Phtheirospermum japonicum]
MIDKAKMVMGLNWKATGIDELVAVGFCFGSSDGMVIGFFTPTPETQKPPKEDVIIKEGHRVVVVEFEKDDKHTKVLISPPDPEKITDDALSKTKDEEETTRQHGFKPKEIVCDAYGKCKHKISSVLEKTKEAVAEKAHVAADKAREVEEEAKQGMTEAVEKVKDTVGQTAHQVLDKMHDSKESLKEAKDKAAEKAGEIKEGAEKVKEEVKEKASEKMEAAKQAPKRAEKEFSEILHRGRDVWVDAFHYAFSPERLSALSGVLHLMGFAAAYGMCVWVTFASSSVLAGALPRNQFAVVQTRIYPVYFKAMAYSVGMAMLGHLMGRGPKSGVGMFQGFNLMASLGMILVNLLYLEPRATKVMFERMKREKEEGRGKEGHVITSEASGRAEDLAAEIAGGVSTAEIGGRLEKQQEEIAAAAKAKSEMVRLSEKLQKLNSYSSFLNVLTLMSLTWHLVHLGQRLNVAACV